MKNTEEPIVVEQTFDASLEDVWDAITVLDKMKKWYFPNIESFEPIVGFETRFVVEVEDRVFPHLWKVVEVVPKEKIRYEWRYEGYPGSAIADFKLNEMGNGTVLRLSFTVLEDFPDNIPEFKRESGVEGWNYFIRHNLKQYFEK